MKEDIQQIIETVCEAYSELYATFSGNALINLLCELYPTYDGDGKAVITGARKMLKETYNIR